jgi:hypothetical protein
MELHGEGRGLESMHLLPLDLDEGEGSKDHRSD